MQELYQGEEDWYMKEKDGTDIHLNIGTKELVLLVMQQPWDGYSPNLPLLLDSSFVEAWIIESL